MVRELIRGRCEYMYTHSIRRTVVVRLDAHARSLHDEGQSKNVVLPPTQHPFYYTDKGESLEPEKRVTV